MNNVLLPIAASVQDLSSADQDLEDHPLTGKRIASFDDFAHELRQPLSTIESIAYYLELTVKDEQIRTHVHQIRSMIFKAHQILEHAQA